MCRVRVGDHVILYSLVYLSKTFFFPSERAIRLIRRDCAFHSDPVTWSRPNYMSMRNACLISLIFANLSPFRDRSMDAERQLGADTR